MNRSGTFLQAWSNAEHLRVWYQHFLGIRPDLLNGKVVIEPKLPSEITHLETSVKIGDGTLHYKYKDGKVSARLEGCPAELVVLPVSGQTDSPVFEGVGFCRPDPLDSYPCFLLAEIGYDGYLSVEHFSHPKMKDAIRDSAKFLDHAVGGELHR